MAINFKDLQLAFAVLHYQRKPTPVVNQTPTSQKIDKQNEESEHSSRPSFFEQSSSASSSSIRRRLQVPQPRAAESTSPLNANRGEQHFFRRFFVHCLPYIVVIDSLLFSTEAIHLGVLKQDNFITLASRPAASIWVSNYSCPATGKPHQRRAYLESILVTGDIFLFLHYSALSEEGRSLSKTRESALQTTNSQLPDGDHSGLLCSLFKDDAHPDWSLVAISALRLSL